MRNSIMALMLVGLLAACGGSSKFKSYSGPEVTQIYLSKERRKLYLLNGTDVLTSYDIDLGFNPNGHKRHEGDGRTPEGYYRIDRRNPNSTYHLSLGISYPNSKDIAAAQAAGLNPGGEIFIHGENTKGPNGEDWTAGCIALKDKEIEEVYAMVRDGTPIYIEP